MAGLTGTQAALKALIKSDIITAIEAAGFDTDATPNPNALLMIAALAEGIANAIVPHLISNVIVTAGQAVGPGTFQDSLGHPVTGSGATQAWVIS